MDVSIDPVKTREAYKSLKGFARRLGVPYTTVLAWRGGVPQWRVSQIQALTLVDGKDVFRAQPKAKKKARA